MDTPLAPTTPSYARDAPQLDRFGETTQCPVNLTLQVLNDPRDADQYGNPLTPKAFDNGLGMQLRHEHHGSTQQHRDEESRRLAKHMAQRQQVQKANRLERTSIALVFVDLMQKRIQVGADVSVSVNNPFGFPVVPEV